MSDDLISRQAAINACENGICSCIHDCVDEIRELPSAILKTKTGHWINHRYCENSNNNLTHYYYYSPDYMTCSECWHSFNYDDNCTELFDYCPKCGAKMEDYENE